MHTAMSDRYGKGSKDSGSSTAQPAGAAPARAPGRATLTGALQLRAAGAGSDAGNAGDAQETADRGVSGAGGELPHAGQIQAAFGKHDVSGIRAHVGGPASDANQALGAKAYATGNSVAFGAAPDL